jgi:hypothetical protein
MNLQNVLAKNSQAKARNPPRRENLAWRHATEIDLEAFYYSQTLSHWKRVRELTRSRPEMPVFNIDM